LAKERQENLEIKKALDEKLDKLTSEFTILETTKNGRIK
jgi:3-hydroxyacyl-CoA dehydrogenase